MPKSQELNFDWNSEALEWWLQHQQDTLQLFKDHSNVLSIFLAQPKQKTIVLVLGVAEKEFTPYGEYSLPTSFCGIPTLVQSRFTHLCSTPNINSTLSQIPYVGCSLGSSNKDIKGAGTVGAILVMDTPPTTTAATNTSQSTDTPSKSKTLYVLTAQHVIGEIQSDICAPSVSDCRLTKKQSYYTNLTHVKTGEFGDEVQVTLFPSTVTSVSIDAAILITEVADAHTNEVILPDSDDEVKFTHKIFYR